MHIPYNLAAGEKLMSEIGSERVLTTETIACLKAALLNENKSGHFQFVLLNRHLKYSEYCDQAKKNCLLMPYPSMSSVIFCIKAYQSFTLKELGQV